MVYSPTKNTYLWLCLKRAGVSGAISPWVLSGTKHWCWQSRRVTCKQRGPGAWWAGRLVLSPGRSCLLVLRCREWGGQERLKSPHSIPMGRSWVRHCQVSTSSSVGSSATETPVRRVTCLVLARWELLDVTRVERTGPTAYLSCRRWLYSPFALCARRRVAVWGRLARSGTRIPQAVSGAYVTMMVMAFGVTCVFWKF